MYLLMVSASNMNAEKRYGCGDRDNEDAHEGGHVTGGGVALVKKS